MKLYGKCNSSGCTRVFVFVSELSAHVYHHSSVLKVRVFTHSTASHKKASRTSYGFSLPSSGIDSLFDFLRFDAKLARSDVRSAGTHLGSRPQQTCELIAFDFTCRVVFSYTPTKNEKVKSERERMQIEQNETARGARSSDSLLQRQHTSSTQVWYVYACVKSVRACVFFFSTALVKILSFITRTEYAEQHGGQWRRRVCPVYLVCTPQSPRGGGSGGRFRRSFLREFSPA